MFKLLCLIAACSVLVACGVDGEPVRPTVEASMALGRSGVESNVGVGVKSGPISVFFGV